MKICVLILTIALGVMLGGCASYPKLGGPPIAGPMLPLGGPDTSVSP